jgi:hypothetical protein
LWLVAVVAVATLAIAEAVAVQEDSVLVLV